MEIKTQNLEKKPKRGLEGAVDTGASLLFSLVVGTSIDAYYGMKPGGIAIERLSGLSITGATSAVYGKWRNYAFKKTERLRDNEHIKEILREGMCFTTSALAVLTAVPRQAYPGYADYMVNTGKAQEYLVDLALFNSFQVPIYAMALTIGSLISDPQLDIGKVLHGVSTLAVLSPIVSTVGRFMDRSRERFGLSSWR